MEKSQTIFQNNIFLPLLTPQAVTLGLTKEANNLYNLLDQILLIFKYYINRSREKHLLNIDTLIKNLTKIKKKEKRISILSNNKRKTCNINGA